MKKVKNASELLWVLGIIFVALGVAICSKADLGVSMIAAPAFVVYEAVLPLWSGFSVGMVEYIIQGFMLIILCLVIRKWNWRFLLAFAVAVLYGYALNFFLWLLSPIEFNITLVKWVMLIIGDIIVAFGVACFFSTYMPLQVYELFVAEISGAFKISITKVKAVFDITLLFISVVLAFVLFGDAKIFDWSSITHCSFHSIGLGTLVTTAINSPLINISSKFIKRHFDAAPRFKKLELLLKRY